MRRVNNKSRRKVLRAVACVLIFPFVLTGCMPYKELKDESIVEGVGIDLGSNGYDLTFQIYKPQSGSGGGGGGGSNSKSSSSTVTILQSSGSSLFDAVRNATLQNGRKLYFSNTRAYVVGQEVCRKNFSRLLDFMERNSQVEPSEHMFITKGKAADIMTHKKNEEIVPAVNLELMAQEYVNTSKMANIQLFDIFENVASGITDPIVSAVNLKTDSNGEQVMEMDGTAVFHNNSIAGYLDKTQTRGYLWITGKAKGGVIMLKLPNGGSASLEVLTNGSKISVSGDDKNPVIHIALKVASSLTEVESQSEYTIDSGFISVLNKLQSQRVTTEARDAVNKALSNYDADIFGFGMSIFENKPELWHKIGKKWAAYAKKIKVEITTDSSIMHTGLTTQTVFANKKA